MNANMKTLCFWGPIVILMLILVVLGVHNTQKRNHALLANLPETSLRDRVIAAVTQGEMHQPYTKATTHSGISNNINDSFNTTESPKNTFTNLLNRNLYPTHAELMNVLNSGADPNEKIILPAKIIDSLKSSLEPLLTTSDTKIIQPITRDNFFSTPLMLAVSLDDKIFFDELIKRNADPNIKLHPLGTPPLQLAISSQNLDMVRILLEKGADPNQTSYIGNAASMAVVSWKTKHEAITKMYQRFFKNNDTESLINDFNDLAQKEYANNPNTVDESSFQILKAILEKGADVNVKNYNGLLPIHSALIARNYTAFLMLLPYYPSLDDVKCNIEEEEIPLSFIVAKTGEIELMQILLTKGVNLTQTLPSGDTILDWAETLNIQQVILEEIKKINDKKIKEISNRKTVIIYDNKIEFSIPSMLNIQEWSDGSSVETVDMSANTLSMQYNKKWEEYILFRNEPTDTHSPNIQISYQCQKATHADFAPFDKRCYTPNERWHGEANMFLRSRCKSNLSNSQARTGQEQTLLRWDPIEVIPFTSELVIKTSFCIQRGNERPLEVIQYQIRDTDFIHHISFSYNYYEKHIWQDYFNEIFNSITVSIRQMRFNNTQHEQSNDLPAWKKITVLNRIKFAIPPELELQRENHKNITEDMTHINIAVNDMRAPVIVKQSSVSGDNNFPEDTYIRFTYQYHEALSKSIQTSYNDYDFSTSLLKDMNKSCRDAITADMLTSYVKTGIPQRITKWNPIKVITVKNKRTLKLSYCYQLGNTPPMKIIQYRIQDKDGAHHLTLSYRYNEEEKWLPILKQVLETVEFI